MSMHDNTPAAIAARLLATFRRQLATSRQGQALAAAGLGELADELLALCAGNSANGLALDIEDAVEAARQ